VSVVHAIRYFSFFLQENMYPQEIAPGVTLDCRVASPWDKTTGVFGLHVCGETSYEEMGEDPPKSSIVLALCSDSLQRAEVVGRKTREVSLCLYRSLQDNLNKLIILYRHKVRSIT
jgi:hypothetical protein